MRWKERDPNRWRIRFAFLPVTITGGWWIWLERYWYRSHSDCIERVAYTATEPQGGQTK